jgi:alkylation response protein AidB-like acyl-CoA dehydrogenase
MDMRFTPEQLAFRDEVRTWIAGAMPPHIRKKAETGGYFEHEETMEWHRILYEKGWIAPHWPKEYGGTGWDAATQFIFREECIRAGTPAIPPFAIYMIGPLIIEFGTDEQKARYLPKMLSGEEYWCQGYSEPNAGSDLASLQTKAELDGDHFVLNGQKTWTSHGQYADWIFCLVRTDSSGKKQEGISFILVDIKNTPGVKVVPFLTTGGLPSFCDTYFEDARVPKTNLVGDLHGGWTVAKALLGYERTAIAGISEAGAVLRMLKREAAAVKVGDRRLIDEPGFRQKIAQYEIKLKAIEMAQYRTLAAQQHGKAPGPESSILKLRGSELLQYGYELAMELIGHNSISWFNEEGTVPPSHYWVPSQFNYLRATTIYGGSSEIQKNIIAKLLLGLPSR